MITIFNRKELTATFSLEHQQEVREVLGACGIEYNWKINNHTPARGIANRGSTIHGSRPSEYVIYVAKKDYDKAMHVLHTYRRK